MLEMLLMQYKDMFGADFPLRDFADRQEIEVINLLYDCVLAGKPYEQVLEDCDRDHYFSAQQAVEYGLIDKVLEPGKQIK